MKCKCETYPFTMIVSLLVLMRTRCRTSILTARLLRVHLVVHGVADEVLLGVVPPVLPDTILVPEHCLTSLILAVKVFSVLHLTLLQSTNQRSVLTSTTNQRSVLTLSTNQRSVSTLSTNQV